MRELLTDDTMQVALLTLVDANRPNRLEDNAEAICSVRQQSRMTGYDQAVADLLSLRDAILPPPPAEDTTYEPEP